MKTNQGKVDRAFELAGLALFDLEEVISSDPDNRDRKEIFRMRSKLNVVRQRRRLDGAS